MSSTTTYQCDRCRQNISYAPYRRVLTVTRVDKDAQGADYKVDLCWDCVTLIKQFIRFPDHSDG